MILIEKIEITYFRSFKKAETYNLKDLNIFSGSNDSGKSNILRSLNLFFNNEISPGIPLDIERDFNITKNIEIQNQTKGKKSIDITLFFIAKSTTKLRDNKFSIKKRWNFEGIHSTTVFKDKNWSAEIYNIYREPNLYTKEKLKSDASQRAKSINRFLNSIFFFYVPAIKDERFYSHIFGKLLSTIKENEEFLENKKIERNIHDLEVSINTETNDILQRFKGIGMQFNVPQNLENFFSGFDIGTKDLNNITSSSITIKSRGDGIQAKLIPYLLELLEITQNKKTKHKNTFIWGFEEPENSFEYKNANELALKFKNKYSLDKNRQVFLTTHSFNFLSLEGDNISTYRVFRGDDNVSKILGPIGTKIVEKQLSLLKDSNMEALEQELGIFTLNKELEKIFKATEKIKKEFSKKIQEIEKPVIYTEGNNVEYIKQAKSIFVPNIDIEVESLGGKDDIRKFFNRFSDANFSRYKVFFVFDCDAKDEFTTCESKKTKYLTPYIFKTNGGNSIPEVQKGIENLFNDELFENEEKTFSIVEVTKDRKIRSRQRTLRKPDFCKFICHDRENEQDFVNFKDLFEKIEKVLTR